MTALPAAIDGLVALLRSTPALAGVRIDDGPWVDEPSEHDVIVIGWLPDDTSMVTWTEDLAGLGSTGETFTIQGLVSSFRGDSSLKAVRDIADGLLEIVRAAVHANQTLGGAVNRARIAAQTMTPIKDAKGTAVEIDFIVHLQVY
jgi:hypothetical protein